MFYKKYLPGKNLANPRMVYTKWLKLHFPLLAILGIALALRLWGIHWGLPHAYHPDERLLVARAVHFFTGDFNPHLFIYPSLLMYILFGANVVFYALGALFGLMPPLAQFTAQYHQDPTVFYLINRLVIIVFGVLTVWSVFKIADELFGRKTALLAALLLAILPVHVLHSHYVTTDVPAVFFLTLSFYYALQILKSDSWKNYLLAAFYGGIAASVKYNAGLIVLCIVAAPLINLWFIRPLWWKNNLAQSIKVAVSRKVLFAVTFSVIVYLLTSPYTLLDYKTFFKDFIFQVSVQRRGHGLIFLGMGNKVVQQLWVNLKSWGSVFLWALILGGMIRSVLKLTKARALILFWVVIYFAAMVSSNDLFIRYSLPLAPFLLIIASEFVIHARERKTLAKLFVSFIAFSAIIYTLTFSVLISRNMSRPDVRTQAKAWIEENITAGAQLAIMQDPTGMHDRDDPPLAESDYPILRDRDLRKLLDSKSAWLIMSSYDFNDYLRIGDKLKYTRDNYHALIQLQTGQTSYRLAQRFDEAPRLFGWEFLGKYPIHDMLYCFPTILIYQKITN